MTLNSDVNFNWLLYFFRKICLKEMFTPKCKALKVVYDTSFTVAIKNTAVYSKPVNIFATSHLKIANKTSTLRVAQLFISFTLEETKKIHPAS